MFIWFLLGNANIYCTHWLIRSHVHMLYIFIVSALFQGFKNWYSVFITGD